MHFVTFSISVSVLLVFFRATSGIKMDKFLLHIDLNKPKISQKVTQLCRKHEMQTETKTVFVQINVYIYLHFVFRNR